MSKKINKILFLPKWYPDKYDKQFGIFFQNHAKAVAMYASVASLYVTPNSDQKVKYEIEATNENGFLEVRIYYRKNNSSNTFVRKLINGIRYVRGNFKGLKVVKKQFGKPSINHVNVLSRPGAIALWLKWTTSTPYVITEQWTGYANNNFTHKAKWEQIGSRYIGKEAAGILTVSNSLKSHMQRHGFNNNFYVVGNIIETIKPEFNPKPSNGVVKMMAIAVLNDFNKNVSGLIRTFAKVACETPNIELHIIGGGPDESMLRELAKETGLYETKIIMYGRTINEFVYEKLPEMDFVVTNSNFETFSISTAEALVNGKPVIVTRCGGPEEFVTEEVGMIIDAAADDQLEKAMHHMIKNYHTYSPRTLYEYAHSNFSYEKVGKHFIEIYNTILQSQ